MPICVEVVAELEFHTGEEMKAKTHYWLLKNELRTINWLHGQDFERNCEWRLAIHTSRPPKLEKSVQSISSIQELFQMKPISSLVHESCTKKCTGYVWSVSRTLIRSRCGIESCYELEDSRSRSWPEPEAVYAPEGARRNC